MSNGGFTAPLSFRGVEKSGGKKEKFAVYEELRRCAAGCDAAWVCAAGTGRNASTIAVGECLDATGESPGELDLKIDDADGKSIAVGEAFNLSYLDRNNISNHLKKIFGYDPHGLPENFILVYVDSKDFPGLWKKYCAYLPEVNYPFDLMGSVQTGETKMIEVKCARTAHLRRDKKTYLYHLFINMEQRSD